MKKFLVLLSLLFYGLARADTVNINWYVGDSVYDTSTCTVGGDIILPTAPTKRGHTFLGWRRYIPIEYIESTGTQYIDTGLKGNGNTAVEIRMQFPAQSTERNSGRIFGTRNSINTKAFVIGTGSGLADTTNIFANYGNRPYKNTYISDLYGTWQVFELHKNVFYVNGIETMRFDIENFETEQNLLLFGFIDSDTQTLPLSAAGRYKCSYAKIYDNDVLVRDFIPVLDPSGTPCMYDKVSNTFFYNSGTGNFIAGPVITE